jgi:3-oxoacyl-(acyl-carrier-protein) synthase
VSVVITGLGIVSAAGRGADATERALIELRSGLGPLTRFASARCGHYPVAQVELDEGSRPGSRAVALGTLAVGDALAMAGLAGRLDPARIGLSVGCCVGGLPESEQALADVLAGAEVDPEVWLRHETGATTAALAAEAGLAGPRITASSACASSAQALANGAELVLSGRVDAAVAGGVDALCRLTLNGFASLLLVDPAGCRPFDRGRAGMSLGEGAAFLVLERAEAAAARGARALAVLSGWAHGCDAHHATAPDPSGRGAEAVIRAALERAGLEPEQVDHVNAHGTGTRDNDRVEGQALERVFGGRRVAIASTKRIFGHTLGAAGAIEAAATVLALERAFVPGSHGCSDPDPECAVRPMDRSRPLQPRVALSTSFGFGGALTCLALTTPEVEVAAPRPGLGEPLPVTGWAVAGVNEALGLPPERAVGLPPPGPHKRRARLPALARALAKAAAEGHALPPDTAVFLGTAYGSLTETVAFLENMLREGEAAPMPRAFSASVHNAAAGAVALDLGARGENQTFVHGGLSVVQALFAAGRRARHTAAPALVGALDEATEEVRRAHTACGSGTEPGEGGAVLRLGGPGAAQATVRIGAWGSAPDLPAWLAREEGDEEPLDLILADRELPGARSVLPWAGVHPSASAVALALAVALVGGELPPQALELARAPSRVGVVATARFGEAALLVVERP